MGKYQRDKGARVERKIVNALTDVYPAVDRNWGPQDVRVCGRDLKHTPGLCIQVKGSKANPPWRKGLQEAVDEIHRVKSKDLPVAVTVQDGRQPVVHLLLRDFKKILRAAQAGDPDTYTHSFCKSKP